MRHLKYNYRQFVFLIKLFCKCPMTKNDMLKQWITDPYRIVFSTVIENRQLFSCLDQLSNQTAAHFEFNYIIRDDFATTYQSESSIFKSILPLGRFINNQPIREQHLEFSKTHQRPTCLIGDPSETNMPNQRPACLWRPIRDQHSPIGI